VSQAAIWPALLAIALFWALVSAVAAAEGVHHERRRLALGWTVSFVLSSLAAAYGFWRLL
jgi:hypothetical protein